MKRLILASGSPRRKEIMAMFNIDFEIETSAIEEKINSNERPEQAAMALAFEKGFDIASASDADSIIIAADTLVCHETIMGKPKNRQEAYEMLKELSGTEHKVYTGIAIIEACSDRKYVDYVMTKVHFKPLTDEIIQAYIDSGEVWGKAGAYAIQGLGATLVDSIEGDFFNVVGLPISKVADILMQQFGISLLQGTFNNEA